MTASLLHERLVAAWPPYTWLDLHVVVAVSAGPDSLALLRLLRDQKLQRGGSGQLYVGHVDHQLRGNESADDATWLAEQCRQLEAPLVCRQANPRQQAAVDGDGIEAAARSERYRLLTEIADSVGARYVAVAHHADDQLETVLMRLFRGAGLRGLAAMRPQRPLSRSVSLVRPLLGCTRAELLDYLQSIDQPYRTDSSNLETEVDRNRLRHELMPMIRNHFRGNPAEVIGRTTQQLAAAQATIDRLAADLAAACNLAAMPDRSAELKTAPLAGSSRYVVIETLRLAWRAGQFPERAMTYEHWNRLCDVALAATGRECLPGNIEATSSQGRLVLKRRRVAGG